MYRVLVFVTERTIDRVKQPALLEWPQVVLSTSVIVLLVFMNLAWLIVSGKLKRDLPQAQRLVDDPVQTLCLSGTSPYA